MASESEQDAQLPDDYLRESLIITDFFSAISECLLLVIVLNKVLSHSYSLFMCTDQVCNVAIE